MSGPPENDDPLMPLHNLEVQLHNCFSHLKMNNLDVHCADLFLKSTCFSLTKNRIDKISGDYDPRHDCQVLWLQLEVDLMSH